MNPVRIFLAIVSVGIIVLFGALGWRLSGLQTTGPVTISRIVATSTPRPTATPTEPACADPGAEYYKIIQPLLTEWDDAYSLAGSTSRIALAGQVANLQAIRRKIEAIEPHTCVILAHTSLLLGMEYAIDGFIAFMADKPDSEIEKKFEQSNTHVTNFRKELVRIRGK